MKKLLMLGLAVALTACGGEPAVNATGNLDTDLKTIYGASKVETVGEQLVITLPLEDSSSEANMVFKTFNNMGNSLNYILANHTDIKESNVYYMIEANLTRNDGTTSNENLMGIKYKTETLNNLYQGDDLPFQAYLPFAEMDYKQPLGKKAVLSWCEKQSDQAKYQNVCK